MGGKDGWSWKTSGVRRVLWRLPELIKNLQDDPETPVFLVEGRRTCPLSLGECLYQFYWSRRREFGYVEQLDLFPPAYNPAPLIKTQQRPTGDVGLSGFPPKNAVNQDTGAALTQNHENARPGGVWRNCLLQGCLMGYI